MPQDAVIEELKDEDVLPLARRILDVGKDVADDTVEAMFHGAFGMDLEDLRRFCSALVVTIDVAEDDHGRLFKGFAVDGRLVVQAPIPPDRLKD